MPQQLDIGDNEYEAAPGNYGPRALMTARGDIIRRDSTGFPARLGLGTTGQVLKSDGTDLTYGGVSSIVVHDSGATVASTASETSLLAAGASIASAYAAGVTAGDGWDLDLAGNYTMNVSAQSLRLRIYYGATTILDATTATTTSASARIWAVRVTFVLGTIGAAGAGSAKMLGDRWGLNAADTGTGWVAPSSLGNMERYDGSTVALDGTTATNAAQLLKVTCTPSQSASNVAMTLNLFRMRYSPHA